MGKQALDASSIWHINSRNGSDDAVHPMVSTRRMKRAYDARVHRFGDVLESYDELIDLHCIMPGRHNGMPEALPGLHYRVPYRPSQSLSGIFYGTIARMDDSEFMRFMLSASRSAKSSRIEGPDGIFITDPLSCPYQKTLSDF